jgi:hypothetical protein
VQGLFSHLIYSWKDLKRTMGLFTYYLGYRHAKKKAHRQAAREAWIDSDDDPECDECGHPESRHDDDDRCPNYD